MRVKQVFRSPGSLLLIVAAVGAGLLLGISSIWFSPLWIFVALLGGWLLWTALQRPEVLVIVYLVVTSTVFYETKVLSVPLGFGRIYLTDVILIITFGLIVVRQLVEPGFNIVHTPLDWPLVIFLGASLIWTAVAIYSGSLPFLQSLGELRVAASYLLFFVVTNLVREKRQLGLLINGIIFLGAIVALATIVQYLLGSSQIVLAGRVENYSPADQVFRIIPPGQSLLMVTFLALFVGLVLEPSSFLINDTPRLLLCGLLGVAIVITFFRASWVALGLSALLLGFLAGWRERQRFILVIFLIVLAILLILALVMIYPDSRGASLARSAFARLGSLTEATTYTSPSSSLRWRDFEYSYAFPHILLSPLTGLGLGARYRPYHPPQDWSGFDGRGYIHNGFVWIMMKTGLFGFVGLVWFLVSILVRGLNHWREIPDPKLKAVTLAFAFITLGVLIVSNVEPYVMETPWPPVIAVIAGINEVILAQSAKERIVTG